MVQKRIPKKIIKIVHNYTQRLKKRGGLPIEKVVIFGSYAKGVIHKDSDIDICVVSPKFNDFIKDLKFLLIARKTDEVMAGLEPIGYSPEDFETQNPSPLLAEIKKYGKEVRV